MVRVMIVLAVLGLGDATYLTIVHYGHLVIACAGGHNGHSSCQTVQNSKYSEVGGVTLGLTLFGFGFSAFLTWQETFTITGHPIYCEWCVGSATILTVLLCLSLVRYLRPPGPSQRPLQPPLQPQ